MAYSKWGFLRETQKIADNAGLDMDTGYHRTGLDKYLEVIFPDIDADEWVHDKSIKGLGRMRPDYRCESLKLLIEFDGVQHYQQFNRIVTDYNNQECYEKAGYKVIRIPYFIQLTNEVVKIMFGRDVDEPLFDPTIPSIGLFGKNAPSYCCHEGLKRMAREFKKYPQQYEVNIKALIDANNDFLTGASLLKAEYESL